MIKKTFSLIVLLLLVFSTFTVAQTEETTADPCSGVFGWLGCLLFGSSEARAGKGWFDREDALVGKVVEDEPVQAGTFPGQLSPSQDWVYNGNSWIQADSNEGITFMQEHLKFIGAPTDDFGTIDNEVSDQGWEYWNKEGVLYAKDTQGEIKKQVLNQEGVYVWEETDQSPAPPAEVVTVPYSTPAQQGIPGDSSTPVTPKPTSKPAVVPTQPGAPTAKKAGASASGTTTPVPTPPTPAQTTLSPIDHSNDILLKEEMMIKSYDKAKSLLGEKTFEEYTKANLITLWSVAFSMYQPTYDQKGKVTGYTEKQQKDNDGNPRTVYQLSNGGTLIAVEKADYITLYRDAPGSTLGSTDRSQTLRKDGVTIATQNNEQFVKNTLVVNGESLQVAKGTDVNALTSGKAVPFFSEKGEKIGEAQAAGDEVSVTNYDEETQKTLNTKTGETLDLIGDYSTKTGFLPSGGTLSTKTTTADGTVTPTKYVVDYDYKGTGEDKKLSKVDVYDRRGNKVGVQFDNDGDNVPEAAYLQSGDDMHEIDLATGTTTTIYQKSEDGNWMVVKSRSTSAEGGGLTLINAGTLPPNKIQGRLDAAYTSPGMKTAQKVLESIYALPASIKSYPAISKLLFGETDAYQEWQRKWDKAFAPMLGSNWFPSAICEPEYKWKDNTPQGKAVIKTASGTYQAVASIQMEKSEKKSPILCQKNPDEEADEQWICDLGQVCKEDQFCYADEDDEKPLQGYFYKITWAVSAPQDDALTLYVDENGVAVSFNIVLNPGNIPLYNRMGNLVSPIMLENGASDKDAIIKYSPKEYNEACIVWHQAPSTVNTFTGTTEIPNVCFTVVNSDVGRVEWEQAGQSSARVSENKGEISRNSNW
ncbi:MAG: hypothetical protein AABW48_05125 [Nanoarchaeota archaeon]